MLVFKKGTGGFGPIAVVVVELQDANPTRILDARGGHWRFGDNGRVDEDLRIRFAEHLEAGMSAARGKCMAVVDLVPEIKKRELEARDGWTLSEDDLDRIAADLWSGVHGLAPEVSTVKGKVPQAAAHQ